MDPMEFVTWNQFTGMFWVFGWLAFFLVLKYMSDKKKQHKRELDHKERLAAMEKGLPMPEIFDADEEMATALASNMRAKALNPRWPLGVGSISIMLGLGASLTMWLSGDPYHNQIWPFGLLGVFLGIGLFMHYALTREKND